MKLSFYRSPVAQHRFFVLTLSLLLLAASGLRADMDLEREFDYARKLLDFGLPSYAETVAQRILERHPEEQERVLVIRGWAAIDAGRTDDAEAIIKQLPENSPKIDAIRLHLADYYYLNNELERAKGIYQDFFERYKDELPTDPDILKTVRENAHKFAQMLARQADPMGAAQIYDLVRKASEGTDMERQIMLEQAELLLRAARGMKTPEEREPLLDKAEKNCNEVIWGGMDLWFGRAVTVLAEIKIVRGRKDDAAELLRSNLRMLRTVDDMLRENDIPISESPFAGARSLLGELYQDEADLLLATPEKRHNEALRYFEWTLKEYKSMWNLIKVMNHRDKVAVEREIKEESELPGTPEDRQKPFVEISTALRSFQETMNTSVGEEGWAQGAENRAHELEAQIQALLNEIGAYDKSLGVTVTKEMHIDEHFAGNDYLDRGLVYLADIEMRKDRAIKFYVKALQEYYNVFAGYPGSEWSKESGAKVEHLKERLHTLTGETVNISIKGGKEDKMAKVYLTEGRDLFKRGEYAKAVEAYMRGLKTVPEGPSSVQALAALMECYAQLGDPRRVKMVARYLSERFVDNEDVPQALLRLGRFYFDKKDRPMYSAMYELYLERFPKHHVAPTILFMLGEQRWKVQDYEGAVPYYRRVTELYPNHANALKSLNRIGWSYYLTKQYDKAIGEFSLVVQKAYPGMMKAQAQLCLADSLRQTDHYKEAMSAYRELTKWLIERGSHYAEREGEFREILEQSVFFQAYCLSCLEEPKAQVPAFRKAAVDLYRNFVTRFPTSTLAPTALSSLGAVLLTQDQSEEAANVYEELAEKYPDSEAGQNARFAMIRALVNIGQAEKAREVLRDMINEADQYPPDHFLRIGQMMLENEEYSSAVTAYEQGIKMLRSSGEQTRETAVMEQRSLMGLGRAQFALKNYREAAKWVSDLIDKYPSSGLFYEARFLLGKAYEEQGKSDEAIETLREVFERAQDQTLINRATLELAGIQLDDGNTSEALASYQRIVLLAPDDAENRPLMEQALVGSIKIYRDMKSWADVIEMCDLYLAQFPQGPNVVDVRTRKQQATMQTLGQ